jgi:ribonuclease HIII
MTSHTAALTTGQAQNLRELLERSGFEFIHKDHTLYAAKKDKLSVSVYQKGPKVLIQGKGTAEFIEFHLEPEILGVATLGYEEIQQPEMFAPHFGIDESGKGDYLGPLVVAGVYTDATITRHFMKVGIMDSKRISSATRVRTLAAAIRDTPGIAYHIITLPPLRYNSLYAEFRNVNRLLAWAHVAVIEKLLFQVPACPRALSDQFAKPFVLEKALKQKKLPIILDQRTKAESDIAVAAASILARERFVEWMDKTSAASGIPLPLGASAAVKDAARAIIEKHGADALGKVAKLHFKTTAEVLDLFGGT